LRSQHLLVVVADLGDIAVIAPAIAVACAALVVNRKRRDAIAWLLAFAACVVVTAALKAFVGPFAFSLFDQTISGASFPSGHAAISLVFYDGLAALLWFGSRALLARAAAVALVLLQALIMIAVYRLRWHPLADMVAGLALGAACLAAAYWRARPRPAELGELAGMGFVVACVVVVLHGERLDDKSLVDRVLGRTPPLESSLPAPPAG
jgi:membrane-associated phospholipid phosphatase